jgi:hypothetical protein
MAIPHHVQVCPPVVTVVYVLHGSALADTLGFKFAIQQREGSLKGKGRPIYLDMQVSDVRLLKCNSCLLLSRQLPLWTLGSSMQCFLISPICLGTLIVELMPMAGRASKLWRTHERCSHALVLIFGDSPHRISMLLTLLVLIPKTSFSRPEQQKPTTWL